MTSVVPNSPMANNAYHKKVQIRPAGLKVCIIWFHFLLILISPLHKKSTPVSCCPLKSMFIPDIFNHVSLPQLAYQGPSPPKSYSSFQVWLKSHFCYQIFPNFCRLYQVIPYHYVTYTLAHYHVLLLPPLQVCFPKSATNFSRAGASLLLFWYSTLKSPALCQSEDCPSNTERLTEWKGLDLLEHTDNMTEARENWCHCYHLGCFCLVWTRNQDEELRNYL